MKTLARFAGLASLALALLAAPGSAEASEVRLGVGADWWQDREAIFQVNLGFEAQVAGPLAMGLRFGGLYMRDSRDFGVPADLIVKLNFEQGFYLEGLAGVWTVVRENHPFNSHFAGGIGVQGKAVSLGVELGVLQGEPIYGARLAYYFH